MLHVIAIDGPVAVGKSTVARRVASSLGVRHLDTGAMYRALALQAMRLRSSLDFSPDELGDLATAMQLDLTTDGRVLLGGEDVSLAVRDESVSRAVARVADCLPVRRALVEQQRRLGSAEPSVLEGRDIGTVVFPDACLKIYLDASPVVRVRRRVEQLERLGLPVDAERVFADLAERDARDRGREWGALRVAPDAVIVDTSDYEERRVVEMICALARNEASFAAVGAALSP